MKAIKFLRLLVALSLMPTIFGCQTSSDSITVEIPASETPKDAALSKTVRQRLLSVDKTQFEHVQVVSKDGTVYLSGPVPSLDARQDAIKRAWEVGGVQSVVNRLEVEK
jgi:osmotically-inducible protein OsmY